MKKLVTLSIVLIANAIAFGNNSAPQQRETYQRYTDTAQGKYSASMQQSQKTMTPAERAQFLLDQAKYMQQVFSSTNPQTVTLPSELVGVIQQMVQLALLSTELAVLETAYAQLEQGFMGPELQQVMGNNSNFMSNFVTYVASLQKMMSFDMQLASLTHAIQNQSDFSKAISYFNTAILPQRLKVNMQLTDLQTMFQQANPQFQQKQTQLQQLTTNINQWIEALMQTASPEKKQQVKDATSNAVKTVTTTPKAIQSNKKGSL